MNNDILFRLVSLNSSMVMFVAHLRGKQCLNSFLINNFFLILEDNDVLMLILCQRHVLEGGVNPESCTSAL